MVNKEKEKKKALMPLANRLGLDEGATLASPQVKPPIPAGPAPVGSMGSLVETAMERRRNEQDIADPELIKKNRKKKEAMNAGTN